jgi:hypothetical protein
LPYRRETALNHLTNLNNNVFRIHVRLRMRRLLWLAVAMFVPGCHGSDGLPRVEVRGKVTYEGVPVKHGMVVFRPANKTKGPSAGTAIIDGQFFLTADKGPTAGLHEVECRIVDAPEAATESSDATRAMHRAGPMKSFSQQVEIKSGPNELEFSFTAAPPAPAKSRAK